MFIGKTFTTLLILVSLCGNLFAQQPSASIIKQPEISPGLRKDAVEFLHQTVKEIPNLKAEENRQYFKIEMARLLWKYDEKESRRMFEEAMKEVKQSIAKAVEDHKKLVEEVKKAKARANLYGMNRASVNANSGRANSMYNATNRPMYNAANRPVQVSDDISIYETGQTFKFRKIETLRKRLITNLTEVDPALAYQFLTETSQMRPNNGSYIYQDTYNPLEREIVTKLLEKNEVDKSAEIVRQILDKDFPRGFSSFLTMIYEKDAVKGSNLAEEVLQKLKTPKGKEISGYAELSAFFIEAVEKSQQKPPMLSEKALVELAKLLGQDILAEMQDGDYYFNPYDLATQIRGYAPREALQITQKAKQKRYTNANRPATNAPYYPSNMAYANTMPLYPANYAANYAANVARKTANSMANRLPTNFPANSKNSNAIPTSTPPIVEIPLPTSDEWMLTPDGKEELIAKLINGKFTADERKKVVEAARQYALETNRWGYARPDRFFTVVEELVMFALASADKEVSDQLLKEAEIYIRPETKNYVDYLSKLMLAVGYSAHRPDRSFALMESLTSINQVIESAVNLGSFIDTEAEMIDNGEVSAVMFLGEARFMQEFYRKGEFPMFLQNLARADFKRTKGLADKFEKPEVKMAAKMLILESLLGEFRETESYGGAWSY